MKKEKRINPSLICAAELTLSTRCHLILPPQLQRELKSSRSRGKAGLAKATRSAGLVAPNLRSQPLLLQFRKIKELRAKALHTRANLPWTFIRGSKWPVKASLKSSTVVLDSLAPTPRHPPAPGPLLFDAISTVFTFTTRM